MNRLLTQARVAVWIAVVVLLEGCAAATVIREQPDFNDENQRHLQQSYRADQVVVRAEDLSR